MLDDGYTLRDANLNDVPVLVKQRRWMFEDMARLKGRGLDPTSLDAMDEAYTAYIQTHLGDGSLHAWVIQAGEQVVASGVVSTISQHPPHYVNVSGVIPYLHSVYTLQEYRRQGLARWIVKQAIDFCREKGFTIFKLHASQEGRPLYESLGFQSTNEMSLKF